MISKIKEMFSDIQIEINQELSKYSYTHTGGTADAIVFPKKREEVQRIMLWVKQHNIPLTVLGNASNLIVQDGGIRGVVMILTEMTSLSITGDEITASAGNAIIEVSEFARDYALTGLEFACGIPGSVGGAIFMNAGAYGGEVSQVIDSVEVLTREGEFKCYTSNECDFKYRHSIFQTTDVVILSVTFKLKKGSQEKISNIMDDLTKKRQEKQPLEYPSCGSVFKRPEGYFAGQLIQESGLQGHRIGGVEVSKKHAGFMVNVDNGTATDYIELIGYVKQTVLERFGVTLETEVKIIGEPEKI